MSDAIFPLLPGLMWNLSKTPMFNTRVMTSVNGRELRASFQAVPKYAISLGFEFLRQGNGRNELDQIEGFFYERRGAFDSFLLAMSDDNQFSCTFVGDGITTAYQVYKQIANLTIPLSHTAEYISDDPLMWEENLDQPMWTDLNARMWEVQYEIAKNGMLTLLLPLAEGDALTVTGTYYYRCRFKDDELTFTNFMKNLWEAKKIDMVASLGNKV